MWLWLHGNLLRTEAPLLQANDSLIFSMIDCFSIAVYIGPGVLTNLTLPYYPGPEDVGLAAKP